MKLKFLFRKRSKKRLLIEVLFAFVVIASISLFAYFKFAYGAVVTWDGGGTTGTCGAGNENNWSCGENWSGNVAPGSGDVATFDGTSTKPAWIDSAITVAGIDINTGYTGTIEASASATIGTSGFAQSAGTWNGNSSTMDINDGSFTVDGGTHNATTGTFTVEKNFTYSGGTLSMTGATVTIDGGGSTDDTTITCTGSLGGTAAISKSINSALTSVGNGCSISLGNSPSTTGEITNNGTITVGTGTWTATGNLTFNNGSSLTLGGSALTVNGSYSTYEGNLTINSGATFPDNIDLTFSGDNHDSFGGATTVACNNEPFNSVTISKADYYATVNVGSDCTFPLGNSPASVGKIVNNGSITVGTGTWTITGRYTANNGSSLTLGGNALTINGVYNLAGGDLTINSGATFPENIDLTLGGDNHNSFGGKTNIACNSVIFNSLTYNKISYNASLVFDSNCTVGNFTRTNGVIDNPPSPYTLTLQGNLSISDTDSFGGANLTLEFGGTNAQTVTQNAGTMSSPVTVNKTSETVTLLTGFTIDSTGSTLTITDGNFDNSSFALDVNGNLTVNDTFTQGSGNVTFGTLTIGGGGVYSNSSTGDIVVGAGGVANSGTLALGTLASCPAADNIAITSSSPSTQRSWTGSGTFSIYNTSVTDQGGTATINALSSTGVSGNGSNWNFYPDECSMPVNPRVKGGSRLKGGTYLH